MTRVKVKVKAPEQNRAQNFGREFPRRERQGAKGSVSGETLKLGSGQEWFIKAWRDPGVRGDTKLR